MADGTGLHFVGRSWQVHSEAIPRIEWVGRALGPTRSIRPPVLHITLSCKNPGRQIGAHALAFLPLPLVFDSADTLKIFNEQTPFRFLLVSVSDPLPLLPPLFY